MKFALFIALLTFLGIVISQTPEERQKFIQFYCGNVCPQHLPSEHCQEKCRMMRRRVSPQHREQMVTFYCGNECPQHLSQEYCQRVCQKHRREAQREHQAQEQPTTQPIEAQPGAQTLEAEVLQEGDRRRRRIADFYCGRECRNHMPRDHCRRMCERYRRRGHEDDEERHMPVDRGEHKAQVEPHADVLEFDDIELMI